MLILTFSSSVLDGNYEVGLPYCYGLEKSSSQTRHFQAYIVTTQTDEIQPKLS